MAKKANSAGPAAAGCVKCGQEIKTVPTMCGDCIKLGGLMAFPIRARAKIQNVTGGKKGAKINFEGLGLEDEAVAQLVGWSKAEYEIEIGIRAVEKSLPGME